MMKATVRSEEKSMNQTIWPRSISGSAEPVAASLKRSVLTGSRMTYSRLIGALFLLGFLSYGVGFGLVTSVTGSHNFLTTISAHRTILTIGAFLMLLNSAVDVGKGVLFFPILEKYGKRTALAYLAAMIVEVVLLAVGVICLLMIVPVAQQGGYAGQAGAGWAQALGALALKSNTTAYQIAEMSLGFGCLFLCTLLFRTKLIPGSLAIWGLIGYVMLMAGAIAEIFGLHIGVALSVPGGLFEVALGIWLIVKGFAPEAYGQGS